MSARNIAALRKAIRGGSHLMLNRLGLGPVFAYESLLAARRWQVYAGRSLFVAILLMGMGIVWFTKMPLSVATGAQTPTFQQMAQVGEGFFYALAGIQLSLVILAAPAAAAGAICMDRARGTLLHLMVTDLSDLEIVLGKLGARLTPIFGILACGVPVTALAGLLGGVDFNALAGAFAVSLALAVLGCALALVISVWATKTHEALMAVYLLQGLLLLSLPIWWGLARGGGIMNPPGWFQKGNPYVLVFSPYSKPGFVTGLDYAVFVAAALALAGLMVVVTILRLRPVVVAQTGRSETARRRMPERVIRLFPTLVGPSLDGNPVLWREWHRNCPSRLAARIWATLAITCWLMVVWGTVDVVRYGNQPGPSTLSLGLLLQLVFGLLMLAATAPTALAEERVRGSLDVLLTTPISTRSIVVGKWLGSYRTVLLLAVLPIYVVGMMAATMPTSPPWLTAALKLPHPVVPISDGERVLAVLVSALDFLVSGAFIVTIALAFATWIRRLGRAVTWSVVTFFLLGIGMPILSETIVMQVLARMGSGSNETLRWIAQSAMMLSPIVGSVHPVDILYDYSWVGRSFQWQGAAIVISVKVVVTALLFRSVLKTFDRCLGRTPERRSSMRAQSGPSFEEPSPSTEEAVELEGALPEVIS